LSRLDCTYTRAGDDFSVTPPSYRFDLAIEEDFVEEVARLYGYDAIPAVAAAHAQPMRPTAKRCGPSPQSSDCWSIAAGRKPSRSAS
jgi:phenylalanyl-tRNA synthetase beta chain